MDKYIIVTDKKNSLLVSLEGKFKLSGKAILNNGVKVKLLNTEPIFTDERGDVKFYPRKQKRNRSKK